MESAEHLFRFHYHLASASHTPWKLFLPRSALVCLTAKLNSLHSGLILITYHLVSVTVGHPYFFFVILFIFQVVPIFMQFKIQKVSILLVPSYLSSSLQGSPMFSVSRVSFQVFNQIKALMYICISRHKYTQTSIYTYTRIHRQPVFT